VILPESFEEKREIAAKRLGISPQGMPRNIAIIMDGNGRWAEARGLARFEGHKEGGKSLESIVLHSVASGIESMSVYSFSMQNWKRPAEEVEFLMYLYTAYLEGVRPSLMENNIRMVHLGRRERLPEKVLQALDDTIELTSENDGMVFELALNYGSRTEIVDAVKKIAQECVSGQLTPEDIDDACIAGHLDTSGLADPDLLIRTSGEMRISNFLLWQISYAEFYVTDVHWPAFSNDEFDKAVLSYSERLRRFGDVKPKVAE
jgi:undecaprenyl diphosphate synthase